jgi:proton glutamate symport protein
LPIKSLGKFGFLTFIIFKGQMLFAAVLGLLFVNIIQPGKYFSPEQLVPGNNGSETHFITDNSASASAFLVDMVPSNIFSSLSSGTLIQVIVFSILASLALVNTKNGDKVLNIFKIFLDAILNLTHWIMELAPFGVFALLVKAIAFTGLGVLSKYAIFFATVLGALFTMLFLVGSLLVHFFTDFSPLVFFDRVKEVMMTAFSTSSSAATIPVTLENMEKEFGVPNKIASFVIPLGATMNMSGAAIYESIVTLFVAQAFLPEPLDLGQQVFVVFMVLLSTFGTPGIPHGSFITLAIVFKAVGLPLEAIAVILGIDRILDMTRTMVNVTFDSISCLILNKYSHLED